MIFKERSKSFCLRIKINKIEFADTWVKSKLMNTILFVVLLKDILVILYWSQWIYGVFSTTGNIHRAVNFYDKFSPMFIYMQG